MKILNQVFINFNETALTIAVELGFVEIVKLLLANKNIDVNFVKVLIC